MTSFEVTAVLSQYQARLRVRAAALLLTLETRLDRIMIVWLLTAGLARDFEQLRIEFLARIRSNPDEAVGNFIEAQRERIDQFRHLIGRARTEGHVSAPMLAQVAGQARILLAR